MMQALRIDTHTHSSVSDGTDTPSELMAQARAAHLDIIGLTDHDTTAGWDEAAQCVERDGVGLLRGMEVTAKCHGISVHILAYLFDPNHEDVIAHNATLLDARYRRIEEMADRLSRDFPITFEDVKRQGAGDVLGRPHVADALVEAGVCKNRDEAFAGILKKGRGYYVSLPAPDACDVIEWIGKAGGKAVMAHPLAPSRGKILDFDSLGMCVDAGLWGLELWHRENPRERFDELESFARNNNLELFGSSDYHGTGKVNRLGENTTSIEVVEKLCDGAALPLLMPRS